MKAWNVFRLVAILTLLMTFYQNCGGGFSSTSHKGLVAESGGGDPPPPVDEPPPVDDPPPPVDDPPPPLGGQCLSGGTPCPLSDTDGSTYLGLEGGLYPGGYSTMPAGHMAAGIVSSGNIQPLDGGGNPAANGRIVMTSLGMSNTLVHFCGSNSSTNCSSTSFVGRTNNNPANTNLTAVNTAQGGQEARLWVSSSASTFSTAKSMIENKGFTEQQVQVAWLLQANGAPRVSLPSSGADAYTLLGHFGSIVRAAKVRYPNLQQVYLSSRIYSCATSGLNPEPYAYETGFAVKWLIEAQIRQANGQGIDPIAGDLDYANGTAPWLSWGPYMWAAGDVPRADGLTWSRGDLAADCTHPSSAGGAKGAGLLVDFFSTDPVASRWYP